jgi:hypothetical protein
MHQEPEHVTDDERGHVPDGEPVGHAGPLPGLREHRLGERQVPGLFGAVVAVDRRQERVGVRVLRHPLLDEIGDLLTAEHEGEEEPGHRDHEVGPDPFEHAIDPSHRPDGLGLQLGDHPLEQPLVAGLLTDLVEEEGDPGIGQLAGTRDLDREPGVEQRLERDPHPEHRRDLLPAEPDPLVGAEVQIEAEGGEELVRDDLARTDLADQVDIGIDHPARRHRGEPFDALFERDRHASIQNQPLVGFKEIECDVCR